MTPLIDDIDPTEDNPGTPTDTTPGTPGTSGTSGTSGTAGTSGTMGTLSPSQITPQIVKNAFYVSGSYITLNYEKFVTQQSVETEFGIANRAASFYIQAVPSSSQGNLLFFKTSDNKIINEQFPLLLPPLSSVIKVKARVNDVSVLNNTVTPSNALTYDIYFKLVAVVERPSTPQGGSGVTLSGGGGSGTPITPDRFAVPKQDNTEL